LNSKKNQQISNSANFKKLMAKIPVMKVGENGAIQLDPNSWNDLMWWLDDELGLNFAQSNKEEIIKYSKENEITILKSFDILHAQSLFE
jgi:hypothetical protein